MNTIRSTSLRFSLVAHLSLMLQKVRVRRALRRAKRRSRRKNNHNVKHKHIQMTMIDWYILYLPTYFIPVGQ